MKKVIKNKSGLSPVVATVLLVGMVIVIALLVFLWMRSLAQESVTKFDGQNIEMVCRDVKFNADYAGGQLVISNDGTVPIFGMRMAKYSDRGHETISVEDINKGEWPREGINQGGVYSVNVNLAGIDKIILSPILLGTSDAGKRSVECNVLETGMEMAI